MHPAGLAISGASHYNLESSLFSQMGVLQNFALHEVEAEGAFSSSSSSSSFQDDPVSIPGARSDSHRPSRRLHWRLILNYIQLVIIMILLISTALLLSQTMATQEHLLLLETRMNASLTRRKNASGRWLEREHFEVILQAMRQGPTWQISAFRKVCQNILRDCVDLTFLRKGSELH